MKKCFECETTEDLHEHHVVPKSKGGTKTITLCHQCHMKAHGRDGKGLHHSRLVQEGLNRAKERGVKLGNPNLKKVRKKAHKARKEQGDETAKQYIEKIEEAKKSIQSQGKKPSLQRIADWLNAQEITTPKGGKWYPTSVKNIVDRAKELGLGELK